MTQKQKAEMAAAILKERRKARELFKSAGKKLEQLVDACEIGEEITLPDGTSARIVDNFAKGNTAFKPVAFSLFDLEETDEVTW